MGIAAAVAFQPDASAEENAERMAEAANHVKTGTVTYAVRDSEYNGVQIHKDDIIGMHNGQIEYSGNSVHDVVMEMMSAIIDDEAELITVYYGADVTKEDAEAITAEIAEKYPDCDCDCLLGGQPLYYYLISVE
jgi:dihydroxyacetone kinase-like predicted kinase